MKIRLVSYRDISLYLRIEKKYLCSNPIISLGADCHPAYVLRALNLRAYASPFDWMNTTPSRGIDYVNKNIDDNFESFSVDLTKNERGYVISRRYKDAEFYHYPDLIDNPETKSALSKRTTRFLDFFNNEKCFFLFNIPSDSLTNDSDLSLFLHSVNEFHRLAKGNHTLLIYIRYDESFQENEIYCNLLEQEIRKIQNTRIARYIRYKSEKGIWGDETKYYELLESLGIKLKLGFPRIYLSKA